MARPIFTDKATLVLRRMLQEPNRAWVVRDFVREPSVSRGWAATVLARLRAQGYLKGPARGRLASATLRRAEDLLQAWTRAYDMTQNRVHIYYTSDPHVLPKIKRFFQQQPARTAYALTLHTGANLITQFVRTPNVYLYVQPQQFRAIVASLRQALDLKELKQGGNIYLIEPHYQHSVWFGMQQLTGYPVVSSVQLYLDLYHLPERGREHAEYLARRLHERGTPLV